MLQQTPVVRVEPVWREWLRRWPEPADLAADPAGEAVRAWGRLGYPRRALRLHQVAVAITKDWGGAVPATAADLRTLPGVGGYTAAAVAAFAFGQRSAVVDTNVRRVQARLLGGSAQAAPALTRAEQARAEVALPVEQDRAREWSVAVIELGALVCLARTPRCSLCPVLGRCAWVRAGRPAYEGPVRRSQPWLGTDRQARGALLAALRGSAEPLGAEALATAWPTDRTQRERALTALLFDGLVEHAAGDRFGLPSGGRYCGPSAPSARRRTLDQR